jgi:hypothetical protein
MDGYVTNALAPFATAAGTAATNTTSRTDITPTPAPIILPYQIRIGSKIRMEADGEYTSNASITFSIGFYVATSQGAAGAPGAISVVLMEATTGSVTATAWPWRAHGLLTVLSIGSAGSVLGMGDIMYGTSLTAFTVIPMPTTAAARTVSSIAMNGPLVAGVAGTMSAASASHNIKCNNFVVSLLN